MKIKEIVSELNQFAPLCLQESYDNSGLNVGNPENEITGILICIDIIPEVVEEAIAKNCNLIISHHPLIYSKISKITGANRVEKSIILAIKNDISIYCGHTNYDNLKLGVSNKMAEKLELKNRKILDPKPDMVGKISVYVPLEHSEKVRNAMFEAGAGNLGNYDCCSYNTTGFGTFKPNSEAKPFVGEKNEIHTEKEIKIEVVYQKYLEDQIIKAMLDAHPYEEVAYNIEKNENRNDIAGFGIYGELEEEITEKELLTRVKNIFQVKNIRHSKLLNKKIKKIAVCGGSGNFLVEKAKSLNNHVFITAELKYHDYFLAEEKIILIDIGHYESEQFTKEIFFEIIKKKNVNFAVQISDINTNPINNF